MTRNELTEVLRPILSRGEEPTDEFVLKNLVPVMQRWLKNKNDINRAMDEWDNVVAELLGLSNEEDNNRA